MGRRTARIVHHNVYPAGPRNNGVHKSFCLFRIPDVAGIKMYAVRQRIRSVPTANGNIASRIGKARGDAAPKAARPARYNGALTGKVDSRFRHNLHVIFTRIESQNGFQLTICVFNDKKNYECLDSIWFGSMICGRNVNGHRCRHAESECCHSNR
jgi:hypothetical protein